jgi:hypothetical protein
VKPSQTQALFDFYRDGLLRFCIKLETKNLLSGISGIPALVVVKVDGTVVTKDGRSHVTGKTPAQAVKDWKA